MREVSYDVTSDRCYMREVAYERCAIYERFIQDVSCHEINVI